MTALFVYLKVKVVSVENFYKLMHGKGEDEAMGLAATIIGPDIEEISAILDSAKRCNYNWVIARIKEGRKNLRRLSNCCSIRIPRNKKQVQAWIRDYNGLLGRAISDREKFCPRKKEPYKRPRNGKSGLLYAAR